MKNIILGLALLCLPAFLLAQSSIIDEFYNQYKGMKDVTSINLSGQLINFVLANANDGTEKIANKITNLRVLLVENGTIVKDGDYKSFLKSVKKDDFEEFMRLKDGGEAVDFHLREDGSSITDVLITVFGDDGFVLLSLEGSFNYDDLEELNLNIEGGEHIKKISKRKKKMDRA